MIIKSLTKILAMIIIAIFTTIFIQPTVIFAANDSNDYNFTDELDADRKGIGFTWKADTKTLTITGIKNSSANLILPDGSKIIIAGNQINTVSCILCKDGDLTIEGNKDASLNVVGYYQFYYSEDQSTREHDCKAIYCKNLTIKSGNINIENDEKLDIRNKN